MSQKYNTYSDDPYVGHSNDHIKLLRKEKSEALSRAKELENEITEIQNNCIHTYLYAFKGMYDDNYICSKCGHDTWK